MNQQSFKNDPQWRHLEGAIRKARADAWARGDSSIEVDEAVCEVVRTLHPEIKEGELRMILKQIRGGHG